MNRLSLASCLFAVVAVVGLSLLQSGIVQASGDPPPPGTYDVGGTVYAVNWTYGYVVVETQKGCFQGVYPDESTVVTVRGVPATLASITVGSRLRSNNSLSTGHALYIDLR